MPNPANILGPINIHGFARSGTTLLQNLLGTTGFIQICNEPMEMLFHCYRGGEALLPSDDREITGLPGDGRDAVRAAHAAYLALLPSAKPSWCQKLGGMPKTIAWAPLVTGEDLAHAAEPYPFPYAWWWRCVRRTFPLAKDLLILRGWRDVVVSRARMLEADPLDVARDFAVYLNLLCHPGARFDHVVRLEHLVAAPEPHAYAICRALGIAYDPRCLRAMEWYASPSKGRDLGAARDKGFAWREEYAALPHATEAASVRIVTPALRRVEARFGTDLQD